MQKNNKYIHPKPIDLFKNMFRELEAEIPKIFKVTVQFERCFRLMEHISIISRRNPINLYITEKLTNSLNRCFIFTW